MKVSSVSVSYQRKFNMGDYNSLGLEVTIWADLEDGDDARTIIEQLQAEAREDVKREYGRMPKSAR